jgi:hypothetical protein
MSTSWHSYPSIYALGHRAIVDLTKDDVLVEEKIDGSQISFGKFGDELKVRSKGQQLVVEAPEKMFKLGVDQIKELDLKDGWTYRGEYLNKPKHNCLCYGRVPDKNIIIFDINPAEEEYLPYEEKKAEAKRIGLECVPLLFHGKLEDSKMLLGLLEKFSILGGNTVEGVVIKNYKRFGIDKKVLMGKFVSEKFKEKHNKEWKKNNPSKLDVIQALIVAYRTEARWHKAVQHLRERGELDGSPKDIGNLLKEVQSDTHKECADEIKEKLFKYAWPKIGRAICGGLPEWYKEQLAKKQFGET